VGELPDARREVTPGASAPTKGHATLDVALAFASFVHATGDRDYLRRTAWPVIEAVAEWAESRVERTRRGYEIRAITGPAEADPPRNNNAFVNMAAGVLLREAIGFSESLGEEPHRLWREIAEGLVLPVASRGRQIPNYDDYRIDQLKAGTPEAAAGIFPVGYRVPRASRRRPSATPSRSRRRATWARRCCRPSCRTTPPGRAAAPRPASSSRRLRQLHQRAVPRDRRVLEYGP
jgi:hypothetical protein